MYDKKKDSPGICLSITPMSAVWFNSVVYCSEMLVCIWICVCCLRGGGGCGKFE